MAHEQHVVLAVLQTLSFGLPPPAGPFVAAGFQLFDLLSGGSPDDSKQKALEDALDTMRQDIENFMTENKLGDVESHLKAMNDWLEESKEALKKGAHATEEETLVDEIVKGSDILLSEDNPVERVLGVLVDLPTRGDDAYTFSLSAVDMYMNVLTSFVCSLKFRCEMRNKLLELAFVNSLAGDQEGQVDKRLKELFADYDLFLGRLDHWTGEAKAKELSTWFEKIKQTRLGLISPVESEGSDGHFLTTSYATDYYNDGGKPVFAKRHDIVFHYGPPGSHALPTWSFTSYKNDVEEHRRQYVEAAKKQPDIDLSFVQEARKGIRDQLNQISIPAPLPTAAPTLQWLDTGWQGAWRWGKEYDVRYGISYLKESSETEVVWGEWAKCPGYDRKCPRLTLPVDPKGAVATRKIKRELRSGGGEVKSKTLLLTENISTLFVDIDPVRGDAACPSPVLPPQIEGWARAYRTPNSADADAPSWPPGYAVRYRYTYVNAAGGSSYPSIWALAKGGERDDEGYASGGDRYLARIKVRKDPNSGGIKVFRQFKGKEEAEVHGDIEAKGGFYTFTDAGL